MSSIASRSGSSSFIICPALSNIFSSDEGICSEKYRADFIFALSFSPQMISDGQHTLLTLRLKSRSFIDSPRANVPFLSKAIPLNTEAGRNLNIRFWNANAAFGTLWGVPISTSDLTFSGWSRAYSSPMMPPRESPHISTLPSTLLQYHERSYFSIHILPSMVFEDIRF